MSDDVLDYFEGLKKTVAKVYKAHPELPDRRREYPLLIGSLGDPFSPVWFVAENPSLSKVEMAVGSSPELQWSVSDGDLLLRRALVANGFKDGELLEYGGWHSYITNVLKNAVRVAEWRKTPWSEKLRVAEAWAPVVKYELENGRPKFLVFLGKNAEKFMTHQYKKGLIPPLPLYKCIYHYTYVASQPQGRLRPGHPEREAAWIEHFADFARRFPPGA